ncbi:MAG: transcription-repair coupling factor [Bacteroidetes bacterium]|nr:transcription-repair coupling factor [Bacteroidota bacterium]MBT6687917.1 transcription-repair coupling factor [Bacteroidota bacterium]MBT7142435.1 transcription-repair coupling factor [Bacteroidota bacterium]MBT7490058.1 transcription-repair coupling factor [Bacteroidota bacterium]
MKIKDLNKIFENHKKVEELRGEILENKNVFLKGVAGSAMGMIFANLDAHRQNLIVLNDREEAAYFANDLENITQSDNILLFPSSFKRSIQYEQIDTGSVVLRTNVLNKLSSNPKKFTIVTYADALIEKVISKKNLKTNSLEVKVGNTISTDFLIEVLFEYNFERNDFVLEPGQFSVRGSIIDVFSFSNDLPYRIDFFGDDVDSIRSFDIENQLSIDNFKKINIIPNIQDEALVEEKVTFLDFIPQKTIIWLKDTAITLSRISDLYKKALIKFHSEENEKQQNIEEIIVKSNFISEKLQDFTKVEFGLKQYFPSETIIEFKTSPQPRFSKDFSRLSKHLYENYEKAYTNIILSESQKQIDRLQSIFNELNQDVEEFGYILTTLHEGFVDYDLLICCYTDHQIFERYHKFKIKSRFKKKEAVTIKEITGFNPGDYVVHSDHGIGQFGGLERIEINGKIQESVRLIYRDGDIIFVNIHSLHRISKYKGKDSDAPKIYKLGGSAWKNLKQKTKSKIKDIAKDLISLYAMRKTKKGFEFSADTYMQEELEASFIYEDTTDQLKSTLDVKKDMESNVPMDRLICGDVGFGKTEVAIRAAFKAVADSKQVALLVPTTILALQHFNTFSERLREFPCTTDYISRFRTAKEQKEIIEKSKNGKIDILIGTHRIAGKDIEFKDLGLLIIDEEQKFGVAVKEKLKKLKLNVDTLTLTATPIPRTMQFSMMGARDLSIINTPPPNRYPISTELVTFNEEIFKEAIEYEIDRGGQVFVINNRIQNIYEVEAMINKICPSVKTVVGHGQMEGRKLEKTMLDFIEGDYGVLIATTIIESGLDIPNVNTIIINNAHNFGLSDLHQLRGRVGRSNKKAFCYLITPPIHLLTSDARRRIKAIAEFSELGSGFNIALQDLDIRGAGNLLGGEQSGFIADIGFDTYNKILNEAIRELKENELKHLFTKEEKKDKKQAIAQFANQHKFVSDSIIDTDLELLFPETYIENISERMSLYRELDNLKNETELEKFKINLIDRFGQIPDETIQLINVVKLRWLAIKLGFEKIVLKKSKMIAYFISDQDSVFYQSSRFTSILNYIGRKGKKWRIKEGNKLSVVVENIDSVEDAINTMSEIEFE